MYNNNNNNNYIYKLLFQAHTKACKISRFSHDYSDNNGLVWGLGRYNNTPK